MVKVWAPLHSARGRVVGAAEVSLDDNVVTATDGAAKRTIWYAVGLVFGLLWLAPGAHGARRVAWMRAQNDDLARPARATSSSRRASSKPRCSRRSRRSNAAVEARDPYTAGHSQRVRRVSLAIGRELRLSARQLGALATAAALPRHREDRDARFDPDEARPARSPRSSRSCASTPCAVPRSSRASRRSAPASPAIRHHHERWDGLGYPDGLSGTSIPVEAAIIAIADAWDAMTTDRPLRRRTRPMNEAMLQIHAGRGKQFNPAVVDAFAAVAPPSTGGDPAARRGERLRSRVG